MLEQWLGADAFRAGVRHYLDRYQLANTETTDLWDALEHATGQPGAPDHGLVDLPARLPRGRRRTGRRRRARSRQRRFRYDGAADATSSGRSRCSSAAPPATRRPTRCCSTTTTTTIATATGRHSSSLNAGGEGFYRVAYPPAWPARLVASGALDRARAVRARRRRVGRGRSRHDAGRRVPRLRPRRSRDETDLVVWRSARRRGCATSTRLVDGDALDASANRRRRARASGVRPARLGPAPGEGPRERQLRGVLLDALGTVGRRPRGRGPRRGVPRPRRHRPRRRRRVHRDHRRTTATPTSSTSTVRRFRDRRRRRRSSSATCTRCAVFPTEELVLRAAELAMTDAVRTQNAPFLVQRALTQPRARPARVGVRPRPLGHDRGSASRARCSPACSKASRGSSTTRRVESVPALLAAHPIPEGERVDRAAPRAPARPPRPRRTRTRALHRRAARRSCGSP